MLVYFFIFTVGFGSSKRRTECVECLQAALQPGLLPERTLIEVVRCEAIHDESVSQGVDKINRSRHE